MAAQLPEPYRRIILLRCVSGASLRVVRKYLFDWRPVSCHQIRKLTRIATAMARYVALGGDALARWPQRFNGKRNLWIGTPPPPPSTTIGW